MMSASPWTYRTRDLSQAISGALKAGLDIRLIQIERDGTISVHTLPGKPVSDCNCTENAENPAEIPVPLAEPNDYNGNGD